MEGGVAGAQPRRWPRSPRKQPASWSRKNDAPDPGRRYPQDLAATPPLSLSHWVHEVAELATGAAAGAASIDMKGGTTNGR